tara:strand:- start:893 stop:1021 length:129 start_codon:yes stop_codon:yes gene_type:complete
MTELRVHFYVDVDLDAVIDKLWDTPLKDLIDYEQSEVDRIDT